MNAIKLAVFQRLGNHARGLKSLKKEHWISFQPKVTPRVIHNFLYSKSYPFPNEEERESDNNKNHINNLEGTYWRIR